MTLAVRTRWIRKFAFLAATAGCVDSPNAPDELGRVPYLFAAVARSELDAAAQGRTARGFEDEILRLEAKVGGVGGVYVDSVGNFVVYVRDQSSSADAANELRNMSATLTLAEPHRNRLSKADGVITRLGQYAFSELVTWQKVFLSDMRAANPAFIAIDADESLNRLRITVSNESAQAEMQAIVSRLGIPSGATVFDYGQRLERTHDIRTTVRPLSGGYQINHFEGSLNFLCTLGWNVNITGIGKGFITAGHCSNSSAGSGATGGYQYQATVSPLSNQVGYEYINPAWNRTDTECAGYTLCTIADVLFVKYSAESNAMPRSVKTEWFGVNNAGGSITADWYLEPIYSSMIPYVGLTLDKIGRTTGWTRGTVTATCAYEAAGGNYGGYLPYTSMVLCHDQFSTASGGPGDSGAPVFYKTATNGIYLAGVMFARSGTAYGSDNRCTAGCKIAFTRWDRIKEHLGTPTMIYSF